MFERPPILFRFVSLVQCCCRKEPQFINQYQLLQQLNLIINRFISKDMNRSSTLDVALNNFQSIFPSLAIPNFNQNSGSFLSTLDNLISSIPVPEDMDVESTVQTMRSIMDQQEYKYQKSLLPEGREQMILFDEDCNYEQGSTGLLQRKFTSCTSDNNEKSCFVEEIWNWRSQKSNQNPLEDYYCFID